MAHLGNPIIHEPSCSTKVVPSRAHPAGCAPQCLPGSTASAHARLAEPLSLGYGEQITLTAQLGRGVQVAFSDVTEDTRCPSGEFAT